MGEIITNPYHCPTPRQPLNKSKPGKMQGQYKRGHPTRRLGVKKGGWVGEGVGTGLGTKKIVKECHNYFKPK